MDKGIPSYPKIHSMGSRFIADIFNEPVVVEEKVDGSQFSAAVIDGELVMRSKGAVLDGYSSKGGQNKLFGPAVDTFISLYKKGFLIDGLVYRGEAIATPKHNALEYARIPVGGVILFDIQQGLEDYLSPQEVSEEAKELGLEMVPVIYTGTVKSADFLHGLMERESCLGKAKIEGVVVKNYARFGVDGKAMMGKYVSEAYKEVSKGNPGGDKAKLDIVESIVQRYATDNRYRKAVEHLRDAGQLEHDVKDIGKLIVEVKRDIGQECNDEIARLLWREFQDRIMRGVVRGLPQYYKDFLLEDQFESVSETDV